MVNITLDYMLLNNVLAYQYKVGKHLLLDCGCCEFLQISSCKTKVLNAPPPSPPLMFESKDLVVFTKASIQITGTLKTLHANSATDSIEYGKIPRSVGIARNVHSKFLYTECKYGRPLGWCLGGVSC